jgi:hypothetical protein
MASLHGGEWHCWGVTNPHPWRTPLIMLEYATAGNILFHNDSFLSSTHKGEKEEERRKETMRGWRWIRGRVNVGTWENERMLRGL